MGRLSFAALTGAGLLAAAPDVALAHMPFMLPNMFDLTDRDHVTIQAGFAEDPFISEVVMKSDAFHTQGPGGAVAPINDVTYLRDLAVFEAQVPAKGTYRISSGERFGRKGKMYKSAAGEWVIGEGAEKPASAQLVDVQSMTLAEVYVTRGSPTKDALAPTGKSLELRPITHPSEIFAAQPATFELLFEGKPVAGANVEVYRSAGNYDGKKKIDGQITTDAAGRFSITAPDAGTYLALIRHRTASPAGAETPYRSYSYTLTFEATE